MLFCVPACQCIFAIISINMIPIVSVQLSTNMSQIVYNCVYGVKQIFISNI